MIDSLQKLWHSILDITALFVIPDWGALVNLIPVLLFFGLVMPLLTLFLLLWVYQAIRAPRAKVTFEEGPRPAPIGDDGKPTFPSGEPFCLRDALIYPFGATRCETCHDSLSVLCPKCGVGRAAAMTTCGNCGLVLRIEPRQRALRPAGPPPGGAAAA